MRIASIYDFKAFPPKGGNHLHALQLMRQFQVAGHEVLTWGDETVPGARCFARTSDGGRALVGEADVLYVRVDGNKMGDDPLLLEMLRGASKPVVWEINSPANENLAFSHLGGSGARKTGLLGIADRAKRNFHAWRRMPGIRREDALRRDLARQVYGVTCVSDGVAKYATEALKVRRVEVIPNGADPEEQLPTGERATLPADFAGKLTVLYAGSPIYPWQGLGVLQETMELCAKHDDPVRFVLLLNQKGPRPVAAPNALVLHAVPHVEVGNYLRAVDAGVYIHPEFFWSEWGNHGSPMKMFEYMAFGRPVIASNVGQIAQVISPGRNGYLFDNSVEGLRQCLLQAARERDRLPGLGRAARLDVERTYNWREVARRTLHMLDAAVEEHAASARSGRGANG